MKFFLDFDPATALAKVRCPVLATFGEHDIQVPTAPNRAAMEKAFAASGLKNHRIEVFPRANHLYQDSPTGAIAEYATLKKEFVPGFLDLLVTWIPAADDPGEEVGGSPGQMAPLPHADDTRGPRPSAPPPAYRRSHVSSHANASSCIAALNWCGAS